MPAPCGPTRPSDTVSRLAPDPSPPHRSARPLRRQVFPPPLVPAGVKGLKARCGPGGCPIALRSQEFSEVRGSKHPIGRGGKYSTTARCTGSPASSLRQTPLTFLRAPTPWAARKARGIARSGGSVQVPGRLPRPFLSDAPIHWGTWKRLSRKFAPHACTIRPRVAARHAC